MVTSSTEMIRDIRGFHPKIGTNTFIAPNASITGEVRIGANCSIWFNTVLRGDVNSITIGDESNIQDGTILHCTYKRFALNIGKRVSIGHGAIVHGCTVEDDVLIGMRATVMDGAILPSGCLIAAGALIPENKILKPGFIYAGIPAKPIKELDNSGARGEIARIAENYQKYASWYK